VAEAVAVAAAAAVAVAAAAVWVTSDERETVRLALKGRYIIARGIAPG